jgi:plasmid stability protein
MKPTTINLPDKTEQYLQQLADATGRSLEDLIQDAITQYLVNQPRTLPKSVGMWKSGKPNLAKRTEELL